MKKTQSIISICLCLILLFTVVSSPVRVKALDPVVTSYLISALMSVMISTGVDLGYEVSSDFVSGCTEMVDWFSDPLIDIFEAQYYLDSSKLTITPAMKDYLVDLIDEHGLPAVFNVTKVMVKSGLVSIPDQTQVYVHSQAQVEALEFFTKEEVFVEQASVSTKLTIEQIVPKYIEQLRSSLISSLSLLREELIEWTGNVNDTVAEFGRDTEVWLGNVNSSVSKWGRDTVDWVKNVNANLVHYSGVLGQKIDNVAIKFDALLEVFPALSEQVDAIVEKIPAYVEPEVIQKPNVQVQVGTQVIAVTDYPSLGKAFEMKLSWIPQIYNFLKELFERITYTGVPPKVVLNLSSSDPSSPWNQEVCVLDMSWYEPYKSYGDSIVSGFLWLGFGWLLYKRTPGIINGLSIEDGYSSASAGKSVKGIKGGKSND